MANIGSGSYNGGVDGGQDVVVNLKPRQKWESPPPPFLLKIYELVDDPETNSFISWNSTGTSFIVWDHNKFAAEILPKYFKTRNFSSFVYQLNNYGFRKISFDRHEYMNPWFQSGKKHWLNNIKRRNQQVHVPKKRSRSTPLKDSINGTMEAKLDAITNEQNGMKEQIQKLKSTLNDMADQLASLQANMTSPELKGEKMNAAIFLKQLLREKRDQGNGSNTKKIKINGPQITGSELEAAEKVELWTKELVSYTDDSGSSTQDQIMNKATENAGNSAFWNGLLDDEDEGDLAAQHSKAIMVLDEMMASDIAMQTENFTAKSPSDSGVEDDCHLVLWT